MQHNAQFRFAVRMDAGLLRGLYGRFPSFRPFFSNIPPAIIIFNRKTDGSKLNFVRVFVVSQKNCQVSRSIGPHASMQDCCGVSTVDFGNFWVPDLHVHVGGGRFRRLRGLGFAQLVVTDHKEWKTQSSISGWRISSSSSSSRQNCVECRLIKRFWGLMT